MGGIVAAFTIATAGMVSLGAQPATAVAAARPRVVPRTASTVLSFSHVFTIVLENYRAEDVNTSTAPYLMSLRTKGVTLDNMYGVDHASLTNYIAMTSGQAANALTRADCITFSSSCLFTAPNDAKIGDQFEAASLSWSIHGGDAGAVYAPDHRGNRPVPHRLRDPAQPVHVLHRRRRSRPDRQAAALHRPRRAVHAFAGDLANHMVPNYSLIVSSTCNDAHDRGVNCSLPTADTWLSQNVPQILASPEYQHGGALFITFDESEITDTRGRCGNSQGGRIFTLVLSPHVGTQGADTTTAYNHYSLLRTIEDGFGLPCLAHACDAGVRPLGEDVWTAGETVTTGWSATDASALYVVSVRLHAYPGVAQKQAAYGLAFITALAGVLGPRPVSPPPGTTGPFDATSGWGPGEVAVLHAVAQYYGLTAEQTQKFAVLVWAYLFAVST